MSEREEGGDTRRSAGTLRAGGAERRAAVSAVIAIALTAAITAGCGQAFVPVSTDGSVTSTAALTSTTQAGPTSSSMAALSTAPPSTTAAPATSVEDIFGRLADAVQPLAVFAPTALPEGAALADRWLPVIASADPPTYDGPDVGNPQVVGSGADSEIQVVFRAGTGWLVVIENFHGDLGDVAGTPVGSVGGRPASLFEVNGGELVQWSQDGRWYGVFGRGVSRDEVVGIALGMKTVPPPQ